MTSDESKPLILGMGNDIIEIARIAKAIQTHQKRFIRKIFTPQEEAYCNRYAHPFQRYAGRFAAKEAVSKALNTGFGQTISWLDIEILNSERGVPQVHLSPQAKIHFHEPVFCISISHCKEYAIATAIWVNRPLA